MRFKTDKISTSILRARLSKGYSQTYLANKLGISQKTYSYLESGKCKLDLVRFLKIAHYTETHPMQIIENIIESDTSWETTERKVLILKQEIEKLEHQIDYLVAHNEFLRETIKNLLPLKSPSEN